MPSTLDRTIAALLPAVPKPLVRYFSSPYIAGETMDDAARVAVELKAGGIMNTMDILGEHVDRREQAFHVGTLKESASCREELEAVVLLWIVARCHDHPA